MIAPSSTSASHNKYERRVELFIIMPVRLEDAEFERRRRRFTAMLPASWNVSLVNLSKASSVPHGLDSAEDILASNEAVLAEVERIEERPNRWIVPDCILDPGVLAARAVGRSRVLGVTDLSSIRLRKLATPFLAVTRNRPITNAYHELLSGLDIPAYRGAASLDLNFQDGHDGHATSRAIGSIMSSHRGEDHTLTVCLNGCSAVDVPPDNSGRWRIIDPMPLARDQLVSLLVPGDG